MPADTSPKSDPLALELDPELEQDTDLAIMDIVRSAVGACKDRDDDLYMLRQQNEGISQPSVQGPWPNSCIIEQPISREFHTTAHSNIMAALRQKPWVTLEALDPADDERIQRVEVLVNTEADLFGFEKSISDMTYTALESRMCVTMVRYVQDVVKSKVVKRFPVEEAAPADMIERAFAGEEDSFEDNPAQYDPPQYEDQLFQSINVTEEIVLDHVDPWDFYTSPVGAKGPEFNDGAEQDIQRLWLTRDQLLSGIIREGFIEEAVLELVERGPTAIMDDDNPRRDQDTLEGMTPNAPEFYECFRVVGRMPYLMDGGGVARVPDYLMDEDFHWMCCPSHGIVFKRTFSPFPVRPYDVGNAIRVPGRMLGHGVVSMLSAIQDEMTAIVRALIDSVNLTMNPMMKVPENHMGHYSKYTTMPGRHLPIRGNDPNSVQPLHWPLEGLSMAFEMLGWLDNQGARLCAAQGVNSMLGGKVRKAAEVDFTENVVQNKFAMMLANLQHSVQNIFRIYISTRLYYLQDKITVRQGDEQIEVAADDLKARCKIIPHANAENASAAQRLQVDQALGQFLQSSPIWQSRIAMGDFTGVYKLDETFMAHLGVRNPQAFLGREPTPGSPEQLLIQVVGMLQQAAQADPLAAQMLQRLQAMAMQGGGLAQQQPQAPPAIAASGMTPPDMTEQDQTRSDNSLANGVNPGGVAYGIA